MSLVARPQHIAPQKAVSGERLFWVWTQHSVCIQPLKERNRGGRRIRRVPGKNNSIQVRIFSTCSGPTIKVILRLDKTCRKARFLLCCLNPLACPSPLFYAGLFFPTWLLDKTDKSDGRHIRREWKTNKISSHRFWTNLRLSCRKPKRHGSTRCSSS